jgi:hypothetical protein
MPGVQRFRVIAAAAVSKFGCNEKIYNAIYDRSKRTI